MQEIHISNRQNRSAMVASCSITSKRMYRQVDTLGRPTSRVRIRKGLKSLDELAHLAGGVDNIAQMLIDGDPEIDLEICGREIKHTSRVYKNPAGEPVYAVNKTEVRYTPEDENVEKSRGPLVEKLPNVATQNPLRCGKLFSRREAASQFIFSRKRQISHVDPLTYDFCFALAQELEAADSLMLLTTADREPLVFTRGSIQYRGLLEGRTNGTNYILVLHLSRMPLKGVAQ